MTDKDNDPGAAVEKALNLTDWNPTRYRTTGRIWHCRKTLAGILKAGPA